MFKVAQSRSARCFLLSGVLSCAFFTEVAAQASPPAIQAWEALAYMAEGGPDVSVDEVRLLTGLYVAMYLAGASVNDRYELNSGLPAAEASPDEAAAQAGAAYLTNYWQVNADDLAQIADMDPPADLRQLGDAAAALALQMVTATIGEPVPYRPFVVPGRYVPTQIPGDASKAHLRHFAYAAKLATQISPPPLPDSDAFVASYIETKRIGSATSTVRTIDETKASMIFDLQDPHPMIFRVLANRDLSLFEQARVLAIYDMGIEDVGAAQFTGKLHFQSWRPITAIRNGDLDDRPETEVEPGWTPLLETPNSSEYPCGHCTFASASAHMLVKLLPLMPGEKVVITADDIYTKNNNRGFDGDLVSYIVGHRMEFDSWEAFAIAGSLSRIHNGAHFRFSIEAGQALGKDIADAVIATWGGALN
ncbi:MAG: vanadium-dependent haloperoxidase [Pseudomonadota bacterium]